MNYGAYVVALTRRVGFRSDAVPNADAALEALASGEYDAALIDQEMPRMTGIELIAATSSRDSSIAASSSRKRNGCSCTTRR